MHDKINLEMNYNIKIDGVTIIKNVDLDKGPQDSKNKKPKIPSNIEDVEGLQYIEE